MKHLKYIFMAFTVALLATSCSQDELLDDGGDTPVTGQTQTYTFTVSPDIMMEGDTKTRSEGTDAEMPTRCFMQVFDNDAPVNASVIKGKENNGSYTFTVTLASDKSYDYCFYADNGTAAIADLRSIEWPTTGNVVAYAHRLSGKPEEVTASVTLKHIVTKITLKHIGSPFTVAAGEEFKITFPCADTYNVLTNTASTGNGYEDFTYTFTEGKSIDDEDEVCSFYTIVPSQVEDYPDITLNLHQLTQTISGIEWKINSHVTLQGDLSEDNPKWGATKEYAEKQIERFFYKDNGDRKGTPDGGDYYFYLPKNDIEKLESVIGAIFHKKVEIRLDNSYNVFDEALGDEFHLYIKYIKSAVPESLLIFVNDVLFCIIAYTTDYNSYGYEDFSTVSDELDNLTE